MDPTCGGKQFACWANVDIAFLVEGEVAPRERSIFSPTFIPDGNVRRDTGANQPAQELGCAVGCISGETGLSPIRSSVRLIITFVATTSS